MKYATLFMLLAIAIGFSAISRGGWWLLLLYPAMSLAIISLSYFRLGYVVYGKRADGRIAVWALLLLLPYLMYLWVVWHCVRLASKEDAWNRLGDGLILSRRLVGNELPADTASVVDLTCEFFEPASLRGRASSVHNYRSFPMLDGSARSAKEIRGLATEILSMPKPVLIHCAQGHGRTGLVAAAVLLVSGSANSVEEAIKMVRAVRPGVGLNSAQRTRLKEIAMGSL